MIKKLLPFTFLFFASTCFAIGPITSPGGSTMVRQTFSNAAVTVNAGTTTLAQTGTMSAARVVTFPAASAYAAGAGFSVVDESGTVTTANKLTCTRAGSDTINGGTIVDVLTAFASPFFRSDGVSKWTMDVQGVTRGGTGTTTGSITVPTQTASASSVAGVGLNFTADPAIAGTTNAGAAAGGMVTVTSGNAARLTSGNAAGGDVTLISGLGIGTGNNGSILFNTTSSVRGGIGYDGHTFITSGRRFYTGGDAAAGNRGGYIYTSSNGLMLGTNSTVDAWLLTSSGHLQPQTDVTYDIGDATHGVRKLFVAYTITGAGTTGAQTINKMRGTVRFAAAASTLVVTNSLVASTSKITARGIGAFDTTATNFQCTAASGSFTIMANAAATAETEVLFDVMIP